ncbi:MAG TPA: hypothetical protein VK420_22835 [Longimicrobium sp.]|nr:hypothetical protein [Longimicrobium sp.]
MASPRKLLPIGLFFLILAVPGLNTARPFLRDARLHGVTEAPEPPPVTFAAFRGGELQSGVEKWFEHRFGFKGAAVKLDNTLTYALFRQTSRDSRVVAGRGGVLFIEEDVGFYNLPPANHEAQLEEGARRLANVQALAWARGKAFVPVIVPSKTSLFPEAVPPELRRALPEPRPSDTFLHQSLVRALRRQGVRYVDGRELLVREQRASGVPMFARGGRHWSQLGACRVLEALAGELRAQGVRSLDTVDCGAPGAGLGPSDGDDDLWRLANLWGARTEPYAWSPLPEREAPRLPSPPTALFATTSFNFKLIHEAARNQLFSRTYLYYYNATGHRWGDAEGTFPVAPGTPEWRERTLSADLYVLDLPEMFLPGFGQGFVEQLQALLREGLPTATSPAP